MKLATYMLSLVVATQAMMRDARRGPPGGAKYNGTGHLMVIGAIPDDLNGNYTLNPLTGEWVLETRDDVRFKFDTRNDVWSLEHNGLSRYLNDAPVSSNMYPPQNGWHAPRNRGRAAMKVYDIRGKRSRAMNDVYERVYNYALDMYWRGLEPTDDLLRQAEAEAIGNQASMPEDVQYKAVSAPHMVIAQRAQAQARKGQEQSQREIHEWWERQTRERMQRRQEQRREEVEFRARRQAGQVMGAEQALPEAEEACWDMHELDELSEEGEKKGYTCLISYRIAEFPVTIRGMPQQLYDWPNLRSWLIETWLVNQQAKHPLIRDKTIEFGDIIFEHAKKEEIRQWIEQKRREKKASQGQHAI